ncbi:hypothetical protein ACFE04_019789 [Oxalis oulophora]
MISCAAFSPRNSTRYGPSTEIFEDNQNDWDPGLNLSKSSISPERPKEKENSDSSKNIIYSYNSLHDSSSLVIPSSQMNDFTSVIARLLEENLKPLEEKLLSLETTNKTLSQEIKSLNSHIAKLKGPVFNRPQAAVSIRRLYDFPLKIEDFETFNSNIVVDQNQSDLFDQYLKQLEENAPIRRSKYTITSYVVKKVIHFSLTLLYSWAGRCDESSDKETKKIFKDTNISRRIIDSLLSSYKGDADQAGKDISVVISVISATRRRHKNIHTPQKTNCQSDAILGEEENANAAQYQNYSTMRKNQLKCYQARMEQKNQSNCKKSQKSGPISPNMHRSKFFKALGSCPKVILLRWESNNRSLSLTQRF